MDPSEQANPGERAVPSRGYGRARGPDVCPHLRSAEGPWRVQHASRDHRCALLARDALLDMGHQRRYCLTEAHQACPINVLPSEPASQRLVATAPVLVERRIVAATPPVLRQAAAGTRRLAIGLGGIGVVALVVVLFFFARGPLAGPGSSPGSSVGASPIASAGATPRPTARGTATAAPSASAEVVEESASPDGSAAPTKKPATTKAPTKTYTVKKGDTLYGIAQKFDTTVAVLKRLNGITDAGSLKVGQKLKVP